MGLRHSSAKGTIIKHWRAFSPPVVLLGVCECPACAPVCALEGHLAGKVSVSALRSRQCGGDVSAVSLCIRTRCQRCWEGGWLSGQMATDADREGWGQTPACAAEQVQFVPGFKITQYETKNNLSKTKTQSVAKSLGFSKLQDEDLF